MIWKLTVFFIFIVTSRTSERFVSVRLELEHVFLTRVWFEYGMVAFLWLMWVGGAGAASVSVNFEGDNDLSYLLR